MISKACIVLGLSLPGLVFAQLANFDSSTLFIKLKPKSSINHPLIKKLDHLFGSVYLAHTDNANLLESALKTNSNVIYTEKNKFSGPRAMPVISRNYTKSNSSINQASNFNDPEVNKIWSFANKENAGVSVEKAYSALPTRNSTPVIVAVVDTGVDYNHEDLKDVMWINENEIADNNIDDDNNGYIDDVHGINTLDRDSNGAATGNPNDSHYHGTHVAGTISAKQNNHIGIAGIAANVKLMAIKTVPSDGDETDRDVVESYLYAAKNGAKLINCSFGKKLNEGGMIVSEAIQFVGETYGSLVVAAAGNDSTPWGKIDIDTSLRYPASYTTEYLLVIAATEKSGRIASYSNVGKKNVDLAAPGSDIYSTLPNNDYGSLSGTSMATPTTVGVAAQILSFYPNLNPIALKKVLMNTVTKVSPFEKWMVSGGRVDLFESFVLLQNNPNQ